MTTFLRVLIVLLATSCLCLHMPFTAPYAWADDGDDGDDGDGGDDGDDDDGEEASATSGEGSAPSHEARGPRSKKPRAQIRGRTRKSAASPRRQGRKAAAGGNKARRASGPVLPTRSYGRDRGDRARSGELSASNLTPGDLTALQEAGFTVLRAQSVPLLGPGVLARLQTPKGQSARAALENARRLVPGALFDLSHLYAPSALTRARTLVQMPLDTPCLTGGHIGLIDGLIDDHKALAEIDLTRKQFAPEASDTMHGTAVASILASAPDKLKPGAEGTSIFAAAVFSGARVEQVADVIDLIAALDWMLQNNVKIINMSLAGPENGLLEQALRTVSERGAIVIAAAGNGGASGPPRYPAAYPETIAVSAVDARGRPYWYNTQGDYIDIAAPGVEIWGADARTGKTALWSGTSFAVPFVTLELAAAAQSAAITTVQEARRYLSEHARDIGPKGRDAQFGAGLLQSQACKAGPN